MSKGRFRLKVPNTFILIFSLLILFAVMTWIIPGGEYERKEFNGRQIVVPDSYKQTESHPQGIIELFKSPIKGFQEAALIIGFILITGGAFNVFQRTGAVDALIHGMVRAHKRSRLMQKMLIPILVTLFSLGGATFGMNEEIIPFVLIFVPLSLALDYDSVVGVAIPLVGAHIGFASAFLNPFNVGIAQGIAEVKLFSGIEYRLIVWFLCNAAAIFFIMWYAAKIKKNPSVSPMYEHDLKRKEELKNTAGENVHLTLDTAHKFVLAIFVLSLAVLVFGVVYLHWFIEEIAALFFVMGIIIGVVGRLKGEEVVKAFIDGAKDLVSTAFVIALAKATVVIAKDGKIIDTMLYGLAPLVESSQPFFAAQKMFIIQSVINFFIHSGSGQAALTMPIMAPLSDIVGVTRQTAILAFQLGELTNIIIPTSGVTIGALTMAQVPYEKWAKWALPLMGILALLALLLLIPPALIHWQ